MPYLDAYSPPLTAQTAAHLLRRAMFGLRPQEIANFVGLTATTAVNQLISNSNTGPTSPPGDPCQPNNTNYNPCPNDPTDYTVSRNIVSIYPVDFDQNIVPVAKRGRPFLDYWVDLSRNFIFWRYVKFWWIGHMADQSAPPSILEKLSLFWQNHFVTSTETVNDYRYTYQYLQLIRQNALGNFRTLVTEMTKDPAMLRYLNGNENVVGAANENYGRELQELFTVGEKDFNGNKNYTENDIKEAARVLTGWKDNFGAYAHNTVFTPNLHDTNNKVFSSYYGNLIISGQGGDSGGQTELDNLVTMLLNHPETSKFICRKLYRWFVHTNVTPDIETNIIIPLAAIFKNNNYAIQPVVEKLLKSQHFFDTANIGSMVKSPADLLIGSLRFFNLAVPTVNTTDVSSFHNYTEFIYLRLNDMQMAILQQPSVFGYEPYFQTGLSRVWINSTSLAQRSSFTDKLIVGDYQINNNYYLKIDLFALAEEAMSTVSRESVLIVERFTKDLFATPLNANQVEFLRNIILMTENPNTSWGFEWNAYKANPNDVVKKQAVNFRLQNLMRYLLRMAEYQLF